MSVQLSTQPVEDGAETGTDILGVVTGGGWKQWSLNGMVAYFTSRLPFLSSATAVPVVKGGTGANNAVDARTNLGLVIGSAVQAYHAMLAGIVSAANVIVLGLTGIGYITGKGVGASVTQITSTATGVTIHNLTGAIQMLASGMSLAAGLETQFTVTNNLVAADDIPVVVIRSFTGGTPIAAVTAVNSGGGSFQITVTNTHASTACTACTLSFAIIKGASS